LLFRRACWKDYREYPDGAGSVAVRFENPDGTVLESRPVPEKDRSSRPTPL
jgi:hypothetical protein